MTLLRDRTRNKMLAYPFHFLVTKTQIWDEHRGKKLFELAIIILLITGSILELSGKRKSVLFYITQCGIHWAGDIRQGQSSKKPTLPMRELAGFFFFFSISLKVCSLIYKLWWYNYVILWHNVQIICAFKVSLLNAREWLLMLQ